MIPVLVDNLSKVFKTKYITTEFGTGNGVADLVLTTEMNDENLFLNDYGLMAMFVSLFHQNKRISTDVLNEKKLDKNRVRKLLQYLEDDDFILFEGNNIVRNRKYKAHTQNLISVEAKLKDWKSGFYQALRYKFFSNKSYLAYPEHYIHRVDLNFFRKHKNNLISVGHDGIQFIFKPKAERPQDVTSYFFLSELFAKEIRKKVYA